MTEQERINRANRAKAALEEFLQPALDTIEADYAEKMISVAASPDPRAPEIIARLANGVKVSREIKSQILRHIADGDIAKRELEQARRLEEMTPAKRRLQSI